MPQTFIQCLHPTERAVWPPLLQESSMPSAFTAVRDGRPLSPGAGSGGARMQSMRAARIESYGGPEVLRIEQVAIPAPGPGQVLLRVAASGVNPLDWKVREGALKDVAPLPLPFTLGWDLCGTVERVGPGAARFAPGEGVMGLADFRTGGAFAEYAVVAETNLIARPKCISHIEAAALPMAGLTAHAALIDLGAVRAKERVLILGGAGGVGHLAVQLAKLQGAWVAATTSRHNLEFVRSLGADLVIERHLTDLTRVLAPVDLVVDTVGAAALTTVWRVLKPNARVRSTVAMPVSGGADGNSYDISLVSGEPNDVTLTELAGLLADGRIRVEVPRVLSLFQTRDALALSQAGRGRGKIVLSIHDF